MTNSGCCHGCIVICDEIYDEIDTASRCLDFISGFISNTANLWRNLTVHHGCSVIYDEIWERHVNIVMDHKVFLVPQADNKPMPVACWWVPTVVALRARMHDTLRDRVLTCKGSFPFWCASCISKSFSNYDGNGIHPPWGKLCVRGRVPSQPKKALSHMVVIPRARTKTICTGAAIRFPEKQRPWMGGC
jgi:hypothetical protein